MTRLMVILAVLVALLQTLPARAQGGPPFLTTDPGTPGNGNWEINVGAAATRAADTSYQLPQLDVNFGLGARLQLSAEIPYVLQTVPGTPQQQGWGNALLGVKWRLLDQGGQGWQLAVFPQLETSGSALARRNGFAVDGPRLLLPLEVARTLGPLQVNLEAGHYLPQNGPHETFVGLLMGGSVAPRLEIGGELYADKASGEPPNENPARCGLSLLPAAGLHPDGHGRAQHQRRFRSAYAVHRVPRRADPAGGLRPAAVASDRVSGPRRARSACRCAPYLPGRPRPNLGWRPG